MSVRIIHESEAETLDLPGRKLSWLVNEELLDAKHLSMCVIRVEPATVPSTSVPRRADPAALPTPNATSRSDSPRVATIPV